MSKRNEPSGLAAELGKRKPFELAEEEAYLNMLRTSAGLSAAFDLLFREHRLSEATYNVLRILRGEQLATEGRSGAGAGAEAGKSGGEFPGIPCQVIADRLVARGPDVTRLVDRLERAQLVERRRENEDRRVVRVRLTAAGLASLARLDEPVRSLHRAQLGHMTRDELAALNALLTKARQRAP